MAFTVNTKKSNKKKYKKEKRFDAEYKSKCGDCITRKATPEELDKYFKIKAN